MSMAGTSMQTCYLWTRWAPCVSIAAACRPLILHQHHADKAAMRAANWNRVQLHYGKPAAARLFVSRLHDAMKVGSMIV